MNLKEKETQMTYSSAFLWGSIAVTIIQFILGFISCMRSLDPDVILGQKGTKQMDIGAHSLMNLVECLFMGYLLFLLFNSVEIVHRVN